MFNNNLSTKLCIYISPTTGSLPNACFSSDGTISETALTNFIKELISTTGSVLHSVILDIEFFKENDLLGYLEEILQLIKSRNINSIIDLSKISRDEDENLPDYYEMEKFCNIFFNKKYPVDAIIIPFNLPSKNFLIDKAFFSKKRIFLTVDAPIREIVYTLNGFKRDYLGLYINFSDKEKLEKLLYFSPDTLFLVNHDLQLDAENLGQLSEFSKSLRPLFAFSNLTHWKRKTLPELHNLAVNLRNFITPKSSKYATKSS